MDMPKPGPGHEKMKLLAGNWVGEETMHPSEWSPEGHVATGRNLNRMALGGFALIIDYTQETGGQVTFSGHGVMTHDAKSDVTRLYWVDSMGMGPEIFEGSWDGDVLVIGHGGHMHTRMTYDLSDPDHWIGGMEMSPDGKTWKKMFDGSYRRA